jgi:hypothetical protein
VKEDADAVTGGAAYVYVRDAAMVTPGLCSKNFSPVIGPISISSGSLWMSLETLSVAGATVITTTDSGLAQV